MEKASLEEPNVTTATHFSNSRTSSLFSKYDMPHNAPVFKRALPVFVPFQVIAPLFLKSPLEAQPGRVGSKVGERTNDSQKNGRTF